MSQENIEVVRAAIDAWNRRDLSGSWRRGIRTPNGVLRSPGHRRKDAVYRGHEGIGRAWRNVRAAWTEYRLEVENARVVGEELVILGHIYVRGASCGIEIDSAWSAIVRFRDGRVVSARDWLGHAGALEGAALSE